MILSSPVRWATSARRPVGRRRFPESAVLWRPHLPVQAAARPPCDLRTFGTVTWCQSGCYELAMTSVNNNANCAGAAHGRRTVAAAVVETAG